MARTPQTISPDAARNHPLTGAPTSTTASHLGSYSANNKLESATPQNTTKVHPTAPRTSDEPFFCPSAAAVLTPSRPPTLTCCHQQPKHHRRAPKPPTFASSKPHKITHLRGRRKRRATIHTANPPFHTTPPEKFCPSPAPAYFCIVIKTETKYKSKNRRQ